MENNISNRSNGATGKVIYLGIDCSLNHAAFVSIRERGPLKIDYFTTTRKTAVAYKGGLLLDESKYKKFDKDKKSVARLAAIRVLVDTILQEYEECYASVEGYAHAARFQAHPLGEVGGLVRLAYWDHNIPFRVHDPITLKVFATGDPKAEKEDMIAKFALERPEDYETVSFLPLETRGDIADAFWLAKMTETEYKLRDGTLLMSDLPSTRIRAFNRVTRDTENILAKEWI